MNNIEKLIDAVEISAKNAEWDDFDNAIHALKALQSSEPVSKAEAPTNKAVLPNGVAVSDVYEAYEAGLKQAQQSSEPVADYTPNKDCTICNGGGMYCVGYSGYESDGNAPILERCECYLDNVISPASVSLEKYNKLLERNENLNNLINKIDGLVDEFGIADSCINVYEDLRHAISKLIKDKATLQAIAEAEEKEG